VFRRQAVFDGQHADAGVHGQEPRGRVVALASAEHPAATVVEDEQPGRFRKPARCVERRGDVAALAGDREFAGRDRFERFATDEMPRTQQVGPRLVDGAFH